MAANQPDVTHLAKAPSPLRFAGAVHDTIRLAAAWTATDLSSQLSPHRLLGWQNRGRKRQMGRSGTEMANGGW
jgi:hypothetical protein